MLNNEAKDKLSSITQGIEPETRGWQIEDGHSGAVIDKPYEEMLQLHFVAGITSNLMVVLSFLESVTDPFWQSGLA